MKNNPFGESDVQKIYEQRFKGNLQYRNRIWGMICEEIFQPIITNDSTVLDLGYGYGEFLRNIKCAKKYGMDLNPDGIDYVPQGCTVIQQDCSAPWQITPNSLDIIFTSNFFEHLPSKTELTSTIREALLALKPHGLLISMGPNIEQLNGKYWCFWDHHLPLTGASLSEGLSTNGFLIKKCIEKFLPYTMHKTRKIPRLGVQLYLRTPILWKLFGKQFLVIAQKP